MDVLANHGKAVQEGRNKMTKDIRSINANPGSFFVGLFIGMIVGAIVCLVVTWSVLKSNNNNLEIRTSGSNNSIEINQE